jgi:hypothetical protein
MTDNNPSQEEEDAHQAWVYAANCLLYEADGGPDVNVGPDEQPRIVSHAEAVQITYAENIVIQCEADLDRLRTAGRHCQQKAAEHQTSRPKYARENARAADLCERAAQIVLDAGAAGNERNRRLLMAITKYNTNMAALGRIPQVAKDARTELEAELAEIDAEPDPAAGIPDMLPFQGPTYDPATGRFSIGEGAEGVVAHWTLNTPGTGMEHGLICGPEGIGKSNVLRIVLAEAMLQPKFALWLADPTGRHNFPDTYSAVADKIATTPRDTLTVLREAVRVIETRTKRGRFPDPTPQRQGVLVAIEDCHITFADDLEATRLAERIVTAGGPVSVGLVVTAPGTDLTHFGGSLTLRTGLARTNRMPMGSNGAHMLNELRRAT